jgi:hypothetical protein
MERETLGAVLACCRNDFRYLLVGTMRAEDIEAVCMAIAPWSMSVDLLRSAALH